MSQFYFDPKRANDRFALPDGEVFWAAAGTWDTEAGPSEEGWYYWAYSPGRLPNGDPIGPFEDEEDAIAYVQDKYEGGVK